MRDWQTSITITGVFVQERSLKYVPGPATKTPTHKEYSPTTYSHLHFKVRFEDVSMFNVKSEQSHI